MKQWRALGLGDALISDAEPILSILVSDGSAPGARAAVAGRAPLSGLLHFDGADGAAAGPLGYMVENGRIREALRGGLIPAKVTVLEGAFAGARFDPRQVRVSLADGRVVTAPLLVGAEGRRSRVRDAAAIKTMGWPYRQTGVVATVKLDRPHLGVAHEIFLPGGPLAVLPLTGQRASLVWTESSAQAQALTSVPREAFEAHLYRRFGEQLGRPELLGSRAAFPLALQMADRMTADRVALVGDAAHAIHPIAGQGLNLGLKDAAALAEVIVDAHRLGEDWGSSLVLDRYARWRRFDAAALAAATDLFNRLFSNDDPLLRAVRGVGLALVEQSRPLKRFFVREASGASGDLPRLLRGEAL
jgi:2-octaprenyl-6-methoxyphenol hydroxylase